MTYPQHYFETAQICLQGHVVTSNYERNVGERTPFCSACGERTIHECPNCHAPIRGTHYVKKPVTTVKNAFFQMKHQVLRERRGDREPYKVPAYCHNCGAPFPWTQSAIAEASDLVEKEMPELSTDEKAEFKAALPKVISDTPLTTRAAKMISRLLKKVAPTANETFKQIIYRLAADGAKVLIWGL